MFVLTVKEMEIKMLKKDLLSGMILELRNGKRYLLINETMINFDIALTINWFEDDLTYSPDNQQDIVKVYRSSMLYSLKDTFKDKHLDLIWERKESNEIDLTDREVEILKALKVFGHTYIARDSNALYGNLYGFRDEPIKGTYSWFIRGSNARLEKDIFKFIKWDDVEPTKIDDLLKGV